MYAICVVEKFNVSRIGKVFFYPLGVFLFVEGRAVAAAVSFSGKLPFLASVHGRTGSSNVARQWISGALAFPAAGLDQKYCTLIWPL
jgi:hypothetical protein